MSEINRKIIFTATAPAAIGPYSFARAPVALSSGTGQGQRQKQMQTGEMASIRRQFPFTPKAPIRQGIYSQAVVVDRTMYISGQIGMDVASGQVVEGGVQAQAKQALINMGEILKAAGCGYNNVVKTTVLLADINDFNNVNEVYKSFFSSNFPARAAYQVAALPRGALVEIEAVAVLGPISDS